MGQALWRLPPRQQQQLQEELADRLADRGGGGGGGGGGRREQGKDGGHQRRVPQQCYGPDIYHLLRTRMGGKEQHGFIDLEMLPPELGITILSYLNATDLCLAGCVWQDLGNDEYLWQGLCKSTWGHCSIYNRRLPAGFSYRRLYLQLDEGSLTFNANAQEGISYFMSKGILVDHPTELAKFIFYTRRLNWKMLRIYLDERRDVLDELVTLHNFSNQFLPNALRDFFRHIHAPEERGEYLETLITKFSHRFCTCNPSLVRELGLSPDAVYVLCYSLILLSIDLTSPHVKNKMSKREFIRNTRRAAHNVSDDFVGHLYDNIYLIGHVAAQLCLPAVQSIPSYCTENWELVIGFLHMSGKYGTLWKWILTIFMTTNKSYQKGQKNKIHQCTVRQTVLPNISNDSNQRRETSEMSLKPSHCEEGGFKMEP